jgi:hypothetical protein
VGPVRYSARAKDHSVSERRPEHSGTVSHSFLFIDARNGLQQGFLGSATPCASPPPWPFIFFRLFFLVHRLVNRDDRHLLTNAMASDFSVA